MKILLLEDSTFYRDQVRSAIAQLSDDFELHEAVTSHEAIRILQEVKDIAVAVLDYDLGFDGNSKRVAAYIRDRMTDPPTVVAYSSLFSYNEKLLGLGATVAFEKDVDDLMKYLVAANESAKWVASWPPRQET